MQTEDQCKVDDASQCLVKVSNNLAVLTGQAICRKLRDSQIEAAYRGQSSNDVDLTLPTANETSTSSRSSLAPNHRQFSWSTRPKPGNIPSLGALEFVQKSRLEEKFFDVFYACNYLAL